MEYISNQSMKLKYLLFIIIPASFFSCNDDPGPGPPPPPTGKIVFEFQHLFHNNPVQFDTIRYMNTAGNLMMFTEIQWFISDVTLHYNNGDNYTIKEWKDIHYIDTDITSTLSWNVFDNIPAGIVDSVTFTFGINEQKNQSFLFVNPPESLMFWPDILGGGYHYLKLNGKWIDKLQRVSPFNFHLGIGQIYDNQGNITGFIQNYFSINPGGPSFNIEQGKTIAINIIMDVDSWFNTPETWDLDFWGGDIMQNQAAMAAACINGNDAFRLLLNFEL